MNMKKHCRKSTRLVIGIGSMFGLVGCMNQSVPANKFNPSLDYAQRITRQQRVQNQPFVSPQGLSRAAVSAGLVDRRARVRLASDQREEATFSDPDLKVTPAEHDTADSVDAESGEGFYKHQSTKGNVRDYTGPLALGDPGMSASLWKESRGGNDLFRDDRAWQPMDLVTIIVTERSEGNNEANTEIKEKSSILASISNFLGFENDVIKANTPTGATTPNIDLSSLIAAETQNDFKGEGKTKRKDSLTAKISAMVAEVLPSGILRIEGQKIISVNSEEKVMILSGLIRPKDINTSNEVDSSKIANMRIDYYGKGVVGEAQDGGWLSRVVRVVWPF